MQITEERNGNIAIVYMDGRLDNETAQGFQEKMAALIDAGCTRLVVDMAKLQYISSVGLRAFLLTSKKLKPLSGKLIMCAQQSHIKEVFDIAGFSSLFPSYATREEASAQFK